MKQLKQLVVALIFILPLRGWAEGGTIISGYELDVINVPSNARFIFLGKDVTQSWLKSVRNGTLELKSPPGLQPNNYGRFRVQFSIAVKESERNEKVWLADYMVPGGRRTVLDFKKDFKLVKSTEVTLPGNNQREDVARLRLVVPLDTIVTINGKKMLQEGEVRDFTSPVLEPGAVFKALVTFDFLNRIGRRVVGSREFLIRAGTVKTFENIEQLSQ